MISYELLLCPFCGAEAKAVFNGSCNYVTCSKEDGCWCSMTCPTSTPEEVCPDGPRYKAIGNSMAVPVMRWIGERIQLSEEGRLLMGYWGYRCMREEANESR